MPDIVLPLPAPENQVHLLDVLPHHCRFISGDPERMMFCGTDKLKGSSYCAYHHKLCYSKRERETKDEFALRLHIYRKERAQKTLGLANYEMV